MKEKKRNRTSRAEAYTNTLQTNAHNIMLHHHHLGEELEVSRRRLRRCHQHCATPKAANRCKSVRLQELLHHRANTTNRTHRIVDPSDPVLLQQNTPIAAPLKNTDPGHSAWGPRLSHRLTLLRATTLKCTGTSPLATLDTALPSTRTSETALRALPTPCRHRGHYCTKRASPRHVAPMDPLHLATAQ